MPERGRQYGVRIGDRGDQFDLTLEEAEDLARAGSGEGPSWFVVDGEGRVISEWDNGVCTWRRG